MDFWKYVLVAVLAYTLGNINSGIIISKLFFNKDIRECGSGNAGTTNAFRCFGVPTGISVMLLDMAKGAFAVYMSACLIFEKGNILAALIGGLFAIIGHIYPAVFGFRGGKGVATVGGMLIMLDFRMFCVMLPIFLIILLTTGYMSLASMSVIITIPISSFCIKYFVDNLPLANALNYVLCVWVFGFIIVFTHRENIKRLIHHEESRIIKWKKKKS